MRKCMGVSVETPYDTECGNVWAGGPFHIQHRICKQKGDVFCFLFSAIKHAFSICIQTQFIFSALYFLALLFLAFVSHVRACTHTVTCMSKHAHTHTHTHTNTHTHIRTRTSTHTQSHTHIHTHTQTHTHTHTHTRTHTHRVTRAHTHTHTHLGSRGECCFCSRMLLRACSKKKAERGQGS